ncbi:MAG: hypothetical protein KC431_10020 [Myxococcales bacterium]|nr:hypothetical protein [Myxococcales bacterium]
MRHSLIVPLTLVFGLACNPGSQTEDGDASTETASTTGEDEVSTSTDSGSTDSTTDTSSSSETGTTETGTAETSDSTGSDSDSETDTGGAMAPDCTDMEPCTGATLWSRAISGPSYQWGSAVATHGDRVFALAFTTDTVVTEDLPDLPGLEDDLVLFEIEAATGTVLWAKVIQGECNATARLTAIADQLFVLGSCAGDVDVDGMALGSYASGAFIVGRFDLDGTLLDAQGFAASNGPVGASWIAAHESGAYALIGYFSSSIDFGLGNLMTAGVQDMVAVVFEADGSPRWSRRFGDGASQLGLAGEFTPDGDLMVFANNMGVIDFGGSPLAGAGIAAARLGGDDGQPLWSALYPNSGGNYSLVSTGTEQGVVLATRGGAATLPSVIDFGAGDLSGHSLIAAFDFDGGLQWQRSFESLSNQAGLGLVYAVDVDNAGSVLIAGHTISTVDLGLGEHVPAGRDGFVAKLDPSGDPTVWDRWVGDWDQQAFEQRLEGVAVDDAGDVYVIGRFAGHVNLGDQELIADLEDMLLAALEP